MRKNRESICRKSGEEIEVKYVLDLRDFPGDPVEKILVHDYQVILEDPEVQVVVETMGGLKPAYEFTRQALLAGKSVCTSNKALVAGTRSGADADCQRTQGSIICMRPAAAAAFPLSAFMHQPYCR